MKAAVTTQLRTEYYMGKWLILLGVIIALFYIRKQALKFIGFIFRCDMQKDRQARASSNSKIWLTVKSR